MKITIKCKKLDPPDLCRKPSTDFKVFIDDRDVTEYCTAFNLDGNIQNFAQVTLTFLPKEIELGSFEEE